MTGIEWQKHIEKLLSIKYGTDYTSIPDSTQGDHGIEGFSSDGKAYQCYFTESGAGLYEHQRNKITDDIKKFIDLNIELVKIFDKVIIKEWILVVPYFNNKSLLKHATKKAEEVRTRRLANVSPDFRISIATENNFWTEREKYLRYNTGVSLPQNPWARIIFENVFYNRISNVSKEKLAFLGESCWKFVTDRLPNNFDKVPWFDMEMPKKLCNNLSLLFRNTELAEFELSTLYIVTTIREAVINTIVAEALEEKFNLFDFSSVDNKSDLQDGYFRFALRYPRFRRKIEILQKSGKLDEAEALALWLLKKSVINNSKIWRKKSEGGLFDLEIFIQNIFKYGDGDLYKLVHQLDLLKLTSYLFREANSFDPSEEKVVKEKEVLRLSSGSNENIRLLLLAMSLSLAERMSFDIVNLDEVVIDYFGVDNELSINDLIAAVEQLNWSEGDNLFIIHTKTEHPAIDYAIRNQVEILNDHGTLLSILTSKYHRSLIGKINVLRFSSEMIEIAEDSKGNQLFKIPHLSFRLAENEIKELIIGGALYGQANVSIRELYQNALDACRFKKARLQYLAKSTEQNALFDRDDFWKGNIKFTQGTDNGRNFIECFDNGIGMGFREIRECFANAGRRYTDQKDFQEEKSQWEKLIPPIEIYPNSQFGIGVFSYFLISDEILVKTRRMDINGKLGETIEVKIFGSGNLCKVRIIDPIHELDKGGTIVRLYLHSEKKISIIDSLQYWLYISEYQTSASNGNSSEEWKPNQLKRNTHHLLHKIIVPTEDENVYISVNKSYYQSDRGLVLQDGIRINGLTEPFIINYVGRNKNRLSVDRSRLIDNQRGGFADHLLDKVQDKSVQYLYQNLQNISLFQLSVLLELFPLLIDNLYNVLVQEDRAFIIPIDNDDVLSCADIRKIGIFPFDYKIVAYLTEGGSDGDKLKLREEIEQQHCNEIVKARWSFLEDFHQTLEPDFSSPFTNNIYRPIDYYYLDQVFKVSNLLLAKLEFSIVAIYKTARRLGVSPNIIYQSIIKFRDFGLNIVRFDFTDVDLQLNSDDEILLKTALPNMGGWLAGTISIYDICQKSFLLKIPIGTVVKRLRDFERLNISCPAIPSQFNDYLVTENDLNIIDFNSSPKGMYHYHGKKDVDIRRILSVSRSLKMQTSDVLKRFEYFQPLFNFNISQDRDVINKIRYNFETNKYEVEEDEEVLKYLYRMGFHTGNK